MSCVHSGVTFDELPYIARCQWVPSVKQCGHDVVRECAASQLHEHAPELPSSAAEAH